MATLPSLQAAEVSSFARLAYILADAYYVEVDRCPRLPICAFDSGPGAPLVASLRQHSHDWEDFENRLRALHVFADTPESDAGAELQPPSQFEPASQPAALGSQIVPGRRRGKGKKKSS